jgi:molybdenum cofactor cytidylyltransferase
MALEKEAKVAAVLLAAGGSSRMGEPKQLLPLESRPMVRHAALAVCEADLAQVVVVVGAQASAVQRALHGMPVEFVINEAWAKGMSTSLRAGLRVLRPEIEAALIVLADQPSLSSGLLRAIVARYQETGAAIVAPVYEGQRGNPVLFDRSLFADLLAVRGDQGGRALFARYRDRLEQFYTDDPGVLLDIDTRDDYDKVRKRHHDVEAKP